mgnify:FL=1|jgi:carboxymethylenebutenolidase
MLRRVTTLSVTMFLAACSVQQWRSSRASVMDEHMSHMTVADIKATPSANRHTADWQGVPGLPPSNNAAAARIQASPRHAEWVKIAWAPGSKDSLMAWIVYPVSSKKAPVVVVVHEIYGLSTWVRGVADQVAAEGFIAIAPDLNSRVRGGPSTDELTRDSSQKIIRGVPNADKDAGVLAAANYAMSQPAAEKKYGVVGYCWGGSVAFNHAVFNGKGHAASVAYYGLPYTGPNPADPTKQIPAVDSLRKIQVPVMLLSGTGDARITAAMPDLEASMKALGKTYESTNYQGAIHGFLRAQDDTPDAAGQANLVATKDAWPKTIAFFKKHLGVK